MKKRIISILTVLSVIMTLIAPSAAVNAELGIKNEFQVSLLAALDIVPGYPSSYDAEAKVSVKNFFDYAYRLVGAPAVNLSEEIKSYGLDEESDAINGAAAVKIIFDIIGYDKMLPFYNNDYNALMAATNVTKGVNIQTVSEEPVTYGQMVMLFWNALNLDAVEFAGFNSYRLSDKTVIEYYLKIYEGNGVVNANNTAAADGGKTTAQDEVRIGNELYLTGNTMTEHLIGSNVRFYYYDDGGDRIIRWIDTNTSKNTTVTVYGNDILSADNNEVIYETNKKSKTVKLDKDCIVIYNGKTAADWEMGIEAVKSQNSYNRFIDNDNNGKFNVVVITDYEYYLVDAISAKQYTVNDYSAGTTVTLGGEETDRLTVYEGGVRKDADAIKAGSVIAVAKSVDLSVITVEILTDMVTGEITTSSADEITVSGTRYTVSPSYAGDALKIGRNGTFYFDNFGRVVRSAGLKEGYSQYGYLLKFYRGEDPEGDCYAELITAEGKRETFPVRRSVNVNDVKCGLKEALQRVDKKQLITYRLNAENVITKINTANKSYIGRDVSTQKFSVHFNGAGKYRKNNMCFNSKYLLDGTTPIFVIPYNEEKKDYRVIDASLLVNNTTYDISVYDIDDYMYASCIVLKENFTEPENLRSKRSVVLTNVLKCIDDEDELAIGIEGYQQGKKVSYIVKNMEMKDNRGKYYVRDLSAGDVIQIGVNIDGEVSAVQLLFKANEKKLAIAAGTGSSNKYWEGGTLVMPDLSVSFGMVTGRNTNVLLVDADGDDSVTSKEPYKFSASTNVYLYENGRISQSNKNDIFRGDNVYIQEYQGNLHEVVVVR
jgi:hypothetical protein